MAKRISPVWDTNKSAPENAARKLPKLAGRYFKAGRKLLKGRASVEILHRFRLETKRFRYTLELFRPCYGPGLDQRLALLRKVQDLLGEINDCVTAKSLIGR